MMAAAIKEQAIRVEGFELQIEGNSRRIIDTRLHKQRQSRGDMSVADWIRVNFPAAENRSISVIFANGRPAKRVDLQKVRASYPADFRKSAQEKKKTEKKVVNTTAQLKAKNKAIRQVKDDLKKSVQEINKAHRDGENNAALDALYKALRKQNAFHPSVEELCMTAISNGLQDTQTVIEWILAAWSHAEKEKDILRGNLGNR